MVRLPRLSPLPKNSQRGKNRRRGGTSGRHTGRNDGGTKPGRKQPGGLQPTSGKGGKTTEEPATVDGKDAPQSVDPITERANQVVQTWANTLPRGVRLNSAQRSLLQQLIEDSLRSPPSADPASQ